jgi:hypothetical protein
MVVIFGTDVAFYHGQGWQSHQYSSKLAVNGIRHITGNQLSSWGKDQAGHKRFSELMLRPGYLIRED